MRIERKIIGCQEVLKISPLFSTDGSLKKRIFNWFVICHWAAEQLHRYSIELIGINSNTVWEEEKDLICGTCNCLDHKAYVSRSKFRFLTLLFSTCSILFSLVSYEPAEHPTYSKRRGTKYCFIISPRFIHFSWCTNKILMSLEWKSFLS